MGLPARTTVRPDSSIAPPEAAGRGSDYAELLRRVKDAGLLDKRPGYYVARIAATGALLVAGWAVFVLLGNSWWQLVVAVFLARTGARRRVRSCLRSPRPSRSPRRASDEAPGIHD